MLGLALRLTLTTAKRVIAETVEQISFGGDDVLLTQAGDAIITQAGDFIVKQDEFLVSQSGLFLITQDDKVIELS